MAADPTIPTTATRAYTSPTREAAAARTRERILTAAASRFAERGFGGATIGAIAREAGVSAPTVYATFGSKAGLLQGLLTQLERGAGVTGWERRISAAEDPHERLRLFARWSGGLYSHGAPLIRSSYRGSDDADVIALRREGDRRRRRGLQTIVEWLRATGRLPAGTSVTDAVDRAEVLTSPAVYLCCVDDVGWSRARYERWLTRLLVSELVGPERRD